MDGLLRLVANASLAHSMPCGGRPPQHVLDGYARKTWMAGTKASGSDAVLRTAMPGHDEVFYSIGL
jgi:hypothetical protein